MALCACQSWLAFAILATMFDDILDQKFLRVASASSSSLRSPLTRYPELSAVVSTLWADRPGKSKVE